MGEAVLRPEGTRRERIAAVKEHLAQFPDVEAVCRRCGQCCYYKIYLDEDLCYTPFPCRFLDLETRLCSVYERRHEVNRACIDLVSAIEMEILPDGCPYVVGFKGYRPPKIEDLDEELVDELHRLIQEDPELVHEAWCASRELVEQGDDEDDAAGESLAENEV